MTLRYLLKFLLLPPAINFLVIIVAWFLLRRWPALRSAMMALSVVSLFLLSLPITSYYLTRSLEYYTPLSLQSVEIANYDAIVVLGGGRHRRAPEYSDLDIPKAAPLERIRYAAYLQNQTGLPILVTGGKFKLQDVPEAEFLERVLEKEFFASVKWQEGQSRTTWENALFSRQILQAEGIDRVLIVTHALHMPRAMYSFTQAGFSPKAAPTAFSSHLAMEFEVLDFVPHAIALSKSVAALHEWLGLAWYQLRYGE